MDGFFVMLAYGIAAGFFAGLAAMLWCEAIWIYLGHAQCRLLRGFGHKRLPPVVAFLRLLLSRPTLAVIHPLPWVVASLLVLLYLMLTGALGAGGSGFLLGFYFWFVILFFPWHVLPIRGGAGAEPRMD